MSINQNPFEIRAGNLPLGFNGTWQDFVDQLPNLLDITVADGFSTFVTGGVTPSSNQGPWFQNGTTLFVWDNDLAAYRGVSLTDSSRGFQISPTAPTETNRYLWFRTNPSGVPQDVRAFQGGQWRTFGFSREDMARIIPVGLTCAWSGTIAQLAATTDLWFLADGGTYNGYTTRDLRNRFIVGAGDQYAVGDTGGIENAPTHTHTIAGSTAGHTLTGSQSGIKSHFHYAARVANQSQTNLDTNPEQFIPSRNNIGNELSYLLGSTTSGQFAGRTSEVGEAASEAHSHGAGSLNAESGGAHDNRPPYYSLAYITFCGLP